uniref:Transposase domain-containing protein n=1 Tax=Mycena chlorophos TaxID=658473 RepID=A0ABQ0LTU9_MYCCL|nr:transposase domain-containing protein [Mycena chlorophos]
MPSTPRLHIRSCAATDHRMAAAEVTATASCFRPSSRPCHRYFLTHSRSLFTLQSTTGISTCVPPAMVAVKKISDGLKTAAIRLHKRRLLPLPTILSVVGFSRATFWRSMREFRTTGRPSKPQSWRKGRKRLALRGDLNYILAILRKWPDLFLDEFLLHLRHNRLLSIHFNTVCLELLRQGISYKKLQKIAAERSEPLRMDFVRRMAEYTPEQLGFIDETSKDERTRSRRYGRAKKGQRAVVREPFVRAVRLSATGLLTLDGMMSTRVVVGSMNRRAFIDFLEHHVMPLTTPFPGPLSVLVMDNAKIHHGDAIRDLANQYGVRIEYLPPYSPDFNPIEEAFSKVKTFIRRNRDVFALRRGAGLLYDMRVAMETITPQDARGYFVHAGYV